MEKINKFPTKRLRVNIEEVFPNDWNANVQRKDTYSKLRKSIKQYGFIDTPLVRLTKDGIYEIIDGEHKWRAAKEEGYKEIDIDLLEGDVDDATAKSLTILLNNLKGEDDILKRAEILKQLREQRGEGQLGLMPFDDKQIEAEIRLLDFDFKDYENAEIETEEKEELELPIKKMKEIVLQLQKIRVETKSKEMRLLIENYMDIVKAFEELLKKQKSK